MTNLIMMSLGGYRFKANKNPYKSVSTQKNYNYASHDRWQGIEASQFKGRKAATKSLSIYVVVSDQSDLGIIPDLERLGDEGKPLKMISSHELEGGYLGEWVITSISVNDSELMRDGMAQVRECTLSIKEWAQ